MRSRPVDTATLVAQTRGQVLSVQDFSSDKTGRVFIMVACGLDTPEEAALAAVGMSRRGPVMSAREAEALVAWWAAGGREVAATTAAPTQVRSRFVLAEWPNFDYENRTWQRPPCDRCGHKYAFSRYAARRSDEWIPDAHLPWRTVPLCTPCVRALGDGLIAWLVQRTRCD